MKNKIDSLFGFLTLYLIISFSCLATQEDEKWNNWSFSGFAKKWLWVCCLPSPMCNDNQESILKDTVTIDFFKDLPLEVLHHILYKLPPLDIFHISKTSKNLNEKIDNRFWEDYLKIHQQEKWEPSLPPLKVAFAYSLYAQGKINKAARLGFPRAIEFLRTRPEEPPNKLSGTPYFYIRYGIYHGY